VLVQVLGVVHVIVDVLELRLGIFSFFFVKNRFIWLVSPMEKNMERGIRIKNKKIIGVTRIGQLIFILENISYKVAKSYILFSASGRETNEGHMENVVNN